MAKSLLSFFITVMYVYPRGGLWIEWVRLYGVNGNLRWEKVHGKSIIWQQKLGVALIQDSIQFSSIIGLIISSMQTNITERCYKSSRFFSINIQGESSWNVAVTIG